MLQILPIQGRKNSKPSVKTYQKGINLVKKSSSRISAQINETLNNYLYLTYFLTAASQYGEFFHIHSLCLMHQHIL